MSELLKKLSPKTIMGEKIKPSEKAEQIFTIFGIARSVRSGETNFGTWTALMGNFEAVRTSDGATFAGYQAFLPEPMNSMIADQLRSEDGGEIEFACNVILKPRPDLQVGYEYIAEPIVDTTSADPLAALRDKAVKALPAPVAEKGKAKGK